MHDGSRNFGELRQTASWYEVRDHISVLEDAELTRFVCDDITEAWICFRYRGHDFSINDKFGDYWFFVQDPACPDLILHTVIEHFREILV